MSVPPDEDRSSDQDERSPDEPLDFDPYRFGRPEHPVPPEYAPPGYVPPPQATQPPPPQYPSAYPSAYPPPSSQQPYTPPAYGAPPYGAPPPSNPYSYPPPPPGYAYGAPKTSNTKATVAMVLGILSIVFCWTTVVDLLLIVPAIVVGALARSDAKRFPERGGRGPATTGLVCGLVAIVLAAAIGAVLYVRIKPCLDNYQMNSHGYNQCVRDRL